MRASELGLVATEVVGELRGQPVQKIVQRDEFTVVMDLRRRWLLLSVDPKFGRLHLLSAKPAGTGEQPPAFCMLLRKHLTGMRLDEVAPVPGERAVRLVFRHPAGALELRLFLFGRSAQLQLVDPAQDDRVLGTIGPAQRNYEGMPPPRDESGPPPRFEGEPSRHLEALLGSAAEAARADATQRAAEAKLRADAKKLERLLAALRTDLARAERAPTLHQEADLLLTFAAHEPAGHAALTVDNPWDGSRTTIALDPALTVVANAQKMHHQARRLERGARALATRITAVEADLAAVTARLAGPLTAAPEPTGRAPAPRPHRAPRKGQPYREFASARGIPILVGRGAEKNDELTFKVASGNDLWLHTRDVAGAHVVVVLDGRPIDEETLLDAATLAAHFSSHRTEAQVDVSYVAKKFVRKPPKSRPGLVTHSGAKTVRIRLEPARIERLLASESR